MKTIAIATVITVLCSLTSCKTDNFYDVTKIIISPDKVEINKPFAFEAILINHTNKQIRLTLDKDITKSMFFSPRWYCEGEPLRVRTPNPKNQSHNFYTTYLQPNDSIAFKLTAQLESFSNDDSLKFKIQGYEKDFRLVNPKCDNFKVNLEGMWLPGDGPFADAMEGYWFKKEIEIKNTTNIGFKRPAAR
jgi:hypothetical protein